MKRRAQRGFTLMTVILIMSLVTISALVVINLVAEEHDLLAEERRSREVREGAESALMEVLNDGALAGALPTLTTPGQKTTYGRSGTSHLLSSSPHRSARDYQAEIELVRIVPMRESSVSVVRAVVYEVDLSAESSVGHRANLNAEIYKVAASQNGIVRPRRHAR